MDRRTRELTAREKEVLDLVRLGLTNDEIAERLGVTSDGVKYHVSQVLSKLGVTSRHEAVAAVFGEVRHGWWERLLVSTALRIAAGVIAVGVVAFVALLTLGVVLSGGSGDAPDVSGLSVGSVVASVGQAVTRPGQVLHSRIVATKMSQAVAVPYYSTELWVDADHQTVRREYRLAPESYHYDAPTESTGIIAGKYSYIQDSPGKAYRYEADPSATGEKVCSGVSSLWMAVLFNCGSDTGPGAAGEPRIEPGEFRGRGAIVIAYGDADLPSIDPNAVPPTVPVDLTPPPLGSTGAPSDVTETIRYSWRIYLDSGGYLPIAYTYAQVDDQGFGVSIEATYDNEFVPIDQHIETLLDPSSIGYGVADGDALLDQVAAKVPVYWLGKAFSSQNGLGDLVLTHVNVGEQQGGTQQVYPVGGELVYTAPDGYPDLQLFLWRKDDWETFLISREGRILTDASCTVTSTKEADGVSSTVYLLPPIELTGDSTPKPGESICNFERSNTALVDRIIGVVQFGDVVVQVRQDGYAQAEPDMRSLMQQLRPR